MTGLDGRIIIIGAGHAGGTAAALLRQLGWAGPIRLIGAEPLAPYQRPPLSKAWLKGTANSESLFLKPDRYYAEAGITLTTGARVVAVNREARTVTQADGAVLGYDHLIIATGSRLRRLEIPGRDLSGIFELRTAADADGIKTALQQGQRLVVVGGGYVGLEVAASARGLGVDVVVIEREARVLARVASPPISRFAEQTHRSHGVRLLTGTGTSAFRGEAGRITAVQLTDGHEIACDLAVVGIGALANDELARSAGLATDNGIVVDAQARTSDPLIHAIGDCTSRPMPLYERRVRLESVPNALEQAKQVVHDLCGKPPPAPEVPWFWSDQYDVKLQIAGMPFDAVSLVTRGDPDSGRFAVFHLDAEGRVQCVEAVNAGAEFMAGRQLIGARKTVSADRLADPAVSMKEIAGGR